MCTPLLWSLTHYDITMGNDVARGIYCDVIMSDDIIMCTYYVITMLNGIAVSFFITTPNYGIAFSPVNSLKLFIKH